MQWGSANKIVVKNQMRNLKEKNIFNEIFIIFKMMSIYDFKNFQKIECKASLGLTFATETNL